MNEMLARIASQTNRYAIYPAGGAQLGDGWYVFDQNEWITAKWPEKPALPPALEPPTTYAIADARRQELNARAVVEAMREPTDEMVAVAMAPYRYDIDDRMRNFFRDTIRQYWQTMIEEILK